ncbi:MAG: YicC family protein [Oscillospiraceae bacterium]|nr:YicC family protein [Oscillospiraceae bacterium]
MIKSMTGYGGGSGEASGKTFSVEVRSVNHRYSDFNIKYPRAYSFAEDAVKKAANEVIKRGKVDIFINVENKDSQGGVVKVDVELARGYRDGLNLLSDVLNISYEPKATDFLRIPDVFTVDKPEDDDEAILGAILSALGEALSGFDEMRRAEGVRLYDDMSERLDVIEELTARIEERAPGIVLEYRERITARMKELMADIPYDEARLMTEVAIFSDKVNVNEEIVRLKSHISQMRLMLKSDEPVGRKLDFLIQEMNREINTTGSKSNDLETARIVIDVKAEIEKLREQCQNVE